MTATDHEHADARSSLLCRLGKCDPSTLARNGEGQDATPGPDQPLNETPTTPTESVLDVADNNNGLTPMQRRQMEREQAEVTHAYISEEQPQDRNTSDENCAVAEATEEDLIIESLEVIDPVAVVEAKGGGTKALIRVCPKNPSHDQGSAWIHHTNSGLISAGCYSCKGKDRWDWYWLRDKQREALGLDQKRAEAVAPPKRPSVALLRDILGEVGTHVQRHGLWGKSATQRSSSWPWSPVCWTSQCPSG